MGKILYIEDQLSSEEIINLFGNFLDDNEQEELFEKNAETIVKYFKNHRFIRVEKNFIDALKLLENDFEQFSFFIIDRNLLGSKEFPSYTIEDTKELSIFGRKIVIEREGDYIFQVLLDKYCKYSNPAILFDNFFYLTANNEAELAYQETFFKKENIIDKGKGIDKFITNKINKFEDLVIKSENKEVFDAFKYLTASHEEGLISIIKNLRLTDSVEITKQISFLRNLFQEILEKVVDTLKRIESWDLLKDKIPKSDWNYSFCENLFTNNSTGNLDVPKILSFLDGLTNKQGSGKDTKISMVTTQYFSHSTFLLCESFWKVSSENQHGGTSAPRPVKYNPSKYTLQILTNSMMDFLLWFGEFMDKYSER